MAEGSSWGGSLELNLLLIPIRVRAGMFIAGKKLESEMVSAAKSNAPWTDRTGNARNGISGKTEQTNTGVLVSIYHTVPYGIYLETRWSGRYATIWPTIMATGPRAMSLMSEVLKAIGA